MPKDAGAAAIPAEPARRYHASVPCFAGTTSVLYQGHDETTGRPVVVKVIREDGFPSAAERQRALRELQKLTAVKHPAFARVLACGEDAGRVWLVRELVEGESLAERLARTGPLAPAEAARIASQVAAALGELHRFGVLHRDVRPGHVLVEPAGAVKLVDACVGRFCRTPEGRTVAGTPGYVAPEAIAGKLVSFRGDLYSLGVTLFESVVGAPPFGAPDAPGVLQRQADSDPPSIPVPVPPALAKLVASLLAREPRERPFSAQQVERQLEPVAFSPEADPDPSSLTAVAPPPSESVEAIPDRVAAMAAQPIDEDGFDDDVPTQVGDSPLAAQNARDPFAALPQAPAPPPSVHSSPRVQLPPARPATVAPTVQGSSPLTRSVIAQTPAHPTAPAPSTALAGAGKPAPVTSSGSARVPKQTILGIAPAPAAAPAAAAAVKVPATPAYARGHASGTHNTRDAQGSGSVPRPPPDDSGDFDEPIDTVVQEDSRIFGIPEVAQGSPHGTAVPPLPDNEAAQVLTGAPRVPFDAEATSGSIPTRGDRSGQVAYAQQAYARGATPGGLAGVSAFAPPRSATASTPGAPAVSAPPAASTPRHTPAPAYTPPPAAFAPPLPAAGPPSPERVTPSPERVTPAGAAPLFPAVPPPAFPAVPPAAAAPAFPPLPPSTPAGFVPVGAPTRFAPTVPPRPASALNARTLAPWLVAAVAVALVAGISGYVFATRSRPSVEGAGTMPVATTAAVPVAPAPGKPSAAGVPVAPAAVAPAAVAPMPALAPPAAPTAAVAPSTPAVAPAAVPAPPPVVAPPAAAQQPTVAAPPRAAAAHAASAPPPEAHHAAASASHANPLDRAREQLAHRDYAGARSSLTALARSQSNSPDYHALLGEVLVAQRDLPAAISEFRNASRLAPRNTRYLHRMADTQLSWNDRNGAVQTLRQIVAIDSHDSHAQQQLDQLTHAAGGRSSGSTGTRPATSSGASGTRPATSTSATPTHSGGSVPIVSTWGPPPTRPATTTTPTRPTTQPHR